MSSDTRINLTGPVTLNVSGNFTASQDLQVNAGSYALQINATGNVAFSKEASGKINIAANGNISLDKEAEITGTISAGGNVTIGKEAEITGNISAGGNVTIDKEAEITGNITAGGNVTIDKEGDITGNIVAGGSLTLGSDTWVNGSCTPSHVRCTGRSLSIAGNSTTEGNSGTKSLSFTVTLSASSTGTVTVNYATSNGTATTADNDYVAASGTLTFTPGQTSKTINVTLNGDTKYESNETFTVTLSGPSGATLGTSTATGTITNDDTAPTLTIANASVTEGNTGTTSMSFTVTQSVTTGLTSTVSYATSAGTATAGTSCTSGVDYITTSGTVTIAAGATTGTIIVPVCGDTTSEVSESITVALSSPGNATLGSPSSATGTINDDDVAATLVAEYRFEEISAYNGTVGELKDTAGYTGGPFNGNAIGSPKPTLATVSPARIGGPGTCGYAAMPGTRSNGGAFSISGLPVSTVAGAKTSVSFWMYWDGTDSVMPIGWNMHDLWMVSGSFGFNTGNSDVYGIASAGLASGWHHVVAVFTNGSVVTNQIYIDGVSQTLTQRRATPNLTTAVVSTTLRVGGWARDTSYRFSGRIDEVRVYNGVLSPSQVTTIYNETHACAFAPHHIELQHPTGTGLTCAASTLTIKACADAASPCTAFTAATDITGTLTSTGAITVNWDGTTGGATGAGFLIPIGSSTVTKNFQLASAGPVVLGTTSITPTPTSATTCNFGSPTCTFTAGTAGFIFSDTATGNTYTIPNQVAGSATAANALYLRAVQSSTTNAAVCTPAIISQTSVPVTLAYACNDPTTCQAGNLLTINSTAVPSAGGSVNLNFDANGSAPITVRYDDVGRITLSASMTVTPFTGGSAVNLTGSSNPFVVKPDRFVLSNIQCSDGTANPAATTAGGAKFCKAGDNFSVSVTAFAADGVTVTKNFGKESSPETVKLTSTLVGLDPLVSANPSVDGSFGAFANGEASGSAFTWNEVGIVTLTPSIGDGNYLTAGDVSGTVSDKVGRFYPYHFVLSTASVTPANGAFSYMNQPFDIAFTLMAAAKGGGTTTNYVTDSDADKNFAKLAPTNAALWPSTTLGSTGFALGAKDGATDLSTRLSLSGAPSGSWSDGVATIASKLIFSRSSAPDGPYEALDIGVAPRDSDGVTLLSGALNLDASTPAGNERQKLDATASKQRFGRLRLLSAYGSELLESRVEYRAEYWSGTRWTTNTDDSTTAIVAANVFSTAATPTLKSIGGLTNGVGYLTYNVPTGAGFFDIAFNLNPSGNDTSCNASHGGIAANAPWLKGFWAATANCGGVAAWAQDPNARVKLGSPKAPYIYLRERY